MNERLAVLASREHGLQGWNMGRFDWEWLKSLKAYRLQGTTRWGDSACLAMTRSASRVREIRTHGLKGAAGEAD